MKNKIHLLRFFLLCLFLNSFSPQALASQLNNVGIDGPNYEKWLSDGELILLGELHSHLGVSKFYKGLPTELEKHGIEVVGLEWVHQFGETALQEYLKDPLAEPGSLEEAYYACRIFRTSPLFDDSRGVKLSKAQFKETVSQLPEHLRDYGLIAFTCGAEDNSLGLVRSLRKIKIKNPNFHVCGIDYTDPVDLNNVTSYPNAIAYLENLPLDRRSAWEAWHGQGLITNFQWGFLREFSMASRILNCTEGKKSLVIVGAAHNGGEMLAGFIKSLLGEKLNIVSLISETYSSTKKFREKDEKGEWDQYKNDCDGWCNWYEPTYHNDLESLNRTFYLPSKDFPKDIISSWKLTDRSNELFSDHLIFLPVEEEVREGIVSKTSLKSSLAQELEIPSAEHMSEIVHFLYNSIPEDKKVKNLYKEYKK